MRKLRYLPLLLGAFSLASCAPRWQTSVLTSSRGSGIKYEKAPKSVVVKKSTPTTTTTEQKPLSPYVSPELVSSAEKKLGLKITTSDNAKLYSEAASWIGVPYKYGGTSKSGVDCSGFTYLMYQAVYGKTLSRQSSAILTNNCVKVSKSELREGDLVFFRTDGKKTSTPNHVGIYLKDQKFVHASSSKGVVVSALNTDYYAKNWLTGGRVSR